jgi:protoporphyrinogen oxidase
MDSVIIVGAGIAGLRIGIQHLKKYPRRKCTILEKNSYIGGRIFTYHTTVKKVGPVRWEGGAGRISSYHYKTLALMKKYGLSFIPISPDLDYLDENTKELQPDNFTSLQSIYFEPLKMLSPQVLRANTLKQLLEKTVKNPEEFYLKFPYYSEIHTMRADIALKSFAHEMHSNAHFGVCKEGMSSIIKAMQKEFGELGGKIMTGVTVTDLEPIVDGMVVITSSKKSLQCKTCILAVQSNALHGITATAKLPLLKKLKMMPLLRIYAVFTTKWFNDLKHITTNNKIRYIIPINAEKGIIMISYTDGDDTKFWMSKPKSQQQNAVMKEIRGLFPERDIPDPVEFSVHYWDGGTTYWLPGQYDVEEESYKSLQPMPDKYPNLYMCGESFSEVQCWVESAIDQADKLLRLLTEQRT